MYTLSENGDQDLHGTKIAIINKLNEMLCAATETEAIEILNESIEHLTEAFKDYEANQILHVSECPIEGTYSITGLSDNNIFVIVDLIESHGVETKAENNRLLAKKEHTKQDELYHEWIDVTDWELSKIKYDLLNL